MQPVRAFSLLLFVAACGGHTEPDAVLAPSAPARYQVDAVTYPERGADDADDLDGDGVPDDRLGTIIGALFAAGEATAGARAAIASGALTASFEVEGDALTWREPGEAPAVMHGSWSRTKAFTSDRARAAAQPSTGTVRLVFYGDPIGFPLIGVEVELRPDGDGYAGTLHGAVRREDVQGRVLPQVYGAVERMLEAHPEAHADMMLLLDTNHDGKVTLVELEANPVVRALVAPDVQLFDPHGGWAPHAGGAAPDALSVGFSFHARRASVP